MHTRSGSPANIHLVRSNAETVFTWDYTRINVPVARLCEKAKRSQWDAADLPWDTEVDQELLAASEAALMGGFPVGADLAGTPFATWREPEWMALNVEAQNWTLSQFLHGEQGALLCTAKLVQNAPSIDAKHFGATQVLDEARHVEVFSRYLDEKLSGDYPVNLHIASLLDDIVADPHWDLTYLGMQVLVEGLALAAFGVIRQLVEEPLLCELLHRVMADEARHVAFGVISLLGLYEQMTAAELRDRQVFTYEAVLQMRDRFAMQEVWERLGIPPADGMALMNQSAEMQLFQKMLFARVVPNCRKLGLLDAGDGWLRRRFDELGIAVFEHYTDAQEESQLSELTGSVLR
jgi:hypothetical protein